jgi:hypothetical protein
MNLAVNGDLMQHILRIFLVLFALCPLRLQGAQNETAAEFPTYWLLKDSKLVIDIHNCMSGPFFAIQLKEIRAQLNAELPDVDLVKYQMRFLLGATTSLAASALVGLDVLERTVFLRNQLPASANDNDSDKKLKNLSIRLEADRWCLGFMLTQFGILGLAVYRIGFLKNQLLLGAPCPPSSLKWLCVGYLSFFYLVLLAPAGAGLNFILLY